MSRVILFRQYRNCFLVIFDMIIENLFGSVDVCIGRVLDVG